LVICADDDPRDAPAAKAVQKAVARWRGEARDVAVATPWSRRRFDKSDFNDLIRCEGPAAVAARIEVALSPRGPRPPGNAALPVDLARLRLQRAVKAFFNAARGFDPDAALLDGTTLEMIVQGVRVGVGLGKSTIARREAAILLAEMRARGDTRTIIFAVPTHKLGNEQARAFDRLPEARAAGLTAGVWRGREAVDPSAPGEAMCRDLEAVRDARSAGLPVETAVCRQRGKGEGASCPFYGVCGYQAQKRRSHDLWFVPHELLFGKKPLALGKVAVVIVDEAAWAKGLEGVSGNPVEMPLNLLHDAVALPQDQAGHEAARLRHVHGITRAALDSLPDGPLRRDAMMGTGLTFETGQDGHRLSWRRVADPGLVPGQSRDQRRELLAQVRENRNAMRVARFFATLEHLLAHDGPEASGWASLTTVEEKDGSTTRVVRLRGRRNVGKDWRVPTLHLDALLNPTLLQPYWPEITVTAEIEGRTPHQRIRQLHGKDWPKSALVPDAWSDAQEGERRLKNSERLRAAVWRLARATNGRVLVVVQKAVEDYWRQAGPIPGNVELAHHNAVAGRDEWGPQPDRPGVVLTVVVGRTLPRPASVEAIVEALTGRALEARASRFDRQDAAIQLADGTTISTEADRHSDPLAEAVRWQICEGELIQIIGRPRGVNRTSANPTEILVLTDRPLPLTIDEAVTWDELAPSAGDLMLAQGGVALVSPSDAARCYPNLWPSPAAAKMAAGRGKWVTSPIEVFFLGECYPLQRATYCRAGQGARPAELVFDPSAVPDLRDWLEERLGPLARLEIEPQPERPAPPPATPRPDSNPNERPPPQGDEALAGSGPWPSNAVALHPLNRGSDPPTSVVRSDHPTCRSSTMTTAPEIQLQNREETGSRLRQYGNPAGCPPGTRSIF
jgi:putative DNA primase/helicase